MDVLDVVNRNAAIFNEFVEEYNLQITQVRERIDEQYDEISKLKHAMAKVRRIAKEQALALDHLKAGQDIVVTLKEQTAAINALTECVSIL